MDILKKGCMGSRVAQLQEHLKKQGYAIQPDGIFGQQTYIAVCQFQRKSGLTEDGIVGEDSWNALTGIIIETNQRDNPLLNYAEVAALLGVEEAAVRAVSDVESGGRTGFFEDGRPVILFESHIFWRELKKVGIDPERYQSDYSDVLSPKWNKTSYKGGIAEYDRLNKAVTINEEAALKSTSWGMFQIMGFNHKLCGYDTVREYIQAIKVTPNNHLVCFAKFLKNTGTDVSLRNLDWETFASKYNGPDYKQNQYDVKLNNAYQKYKLQNDNI